MATLKDVRSAFELEIEQLLEKLKQKAEKHPASSRDAPVAPAPYHADQVAATERLARNVMERVLARLDANDTAWQRSSEADAPSQRAFEEAEQRERQEALTRCRELEELLRRKTEEEARLRAEIAESVQGHFASHLEASKQEVLQLMDSAMCAAAPDAEAAVVDPHWEGVCLGFVEQAERISEKIGSTGDMIRGLESARQAKALQNRANHDIFAFPNQDAGRGSCDDALDAQSVDEPEWQDAISRCQQATKRLRQEAVAAEQDL